MKDFFVGNHKFTFDKEFIDKFESTTGSFLEDCLESFIKIGFGVWDINEVFNQYSEQEIKETVTKIMIDDINLYSGLYRYNIFMKGRYHIDIQKMMEELPIKKVAERIAELAIEEKLETGSVNVLCPSCGKPPHVSVWGKNKERITVRCECGLISDMEPGI